MRKLRWFLILIILPAISLADVTVVSKNDTKTENPGGSSNTSGSITLYSKDSKQLEIISPNILGMMGLTDFQQQKKYILYSSAKTMITMDLRDLQKLKNLFGDELTNLSITKLPDTKVINSFKCQGYKYSATALGYEIKGTVWVTNDVTKNQFGDAWEQTMLALKMPGELSQKIPGYPIYIETNAIDPKLQFKVSSTIEVQSISFAKIPETVFPNLAEYKISNTSRSLSQQMHNLQQTNTPAPAQPVVNNETQDQSKATLSLIDAITNQIENLVAGGFKPENINASTVSAQLPNYSVNTPWNSSTTIQPGVSSNTYVIVLSNTPSVTCSKLSESLKSRKNISNMSSCNANGDTEFSFTYKTSNTSITQ